MVQPGRIAQDYTFEVIQQPKARLYMDSQDSFQELEEIQQNEVATRSHQQEIKYHSNRITHTSESDSS
jgi:hypothetical protein